MALAEINALEMSVDKAQLDELDRTFKDFRTIDKILARALNDAGKKIRSMIIKRSAKVLPYKQKVIKQRVWFRKANRRRLSVQVTGGKKGWPLYLVGKPRQVATGVKVKKLGVILHAFIATLPGAHVGIFVRKGRPRLPIKEVVSDSITDTITKIGAEPAIVAEASAVLAKRVEAQMQLVLQGKRSA